MVQLLLACVVAIVIAGEAGAGEARAHGRPLSQRVTGPPAPPAVAPPRERVAPTLLSPPPAYYPRVIGADAASPTLAVVEAPNATHRRLALFSRGPSASSPWSPTGAIVAAAPAGNDTDLGNGNLLRLHSTNALLCAFRHHDGAGAGRVYRVQVVASLDGGASWGAPVTVTEGPVGVWEPFLALGSSAAEVHVYYSAELANGGEQDVVRQTSADGGRSWLAVDARVHTPGSRNGMPGVAQLPDGSLLAVFEGFWSPAGWGHFTVNSARSFDGGATWPQRAVAHAPADPAAANAGSPQVALCADGRRVAVAFMSSEGGAAGGAAWPDGAHLAVVLGELGAGANASAPVAWGAASAYPTPATVYWPALFTDTTAGGTAWPAWQAADGSAMVGGAPVC